jgi:ribosomal protein L11 methyltransferase
MYLWQKHASEDWLREHSEALMARSVGSLAIVERPGKRALVQVASKTLREASDLQRDFGGKIEKLPANWLGRWARPAETKPLRVGSRLLVSRTPGGPNTLAIPAEAAFGTGDHATTAMCLRLLEQTTRGWKSGWTMLDAGTGSGILALAGRCFGAKRVLALDNDPLACQTAKRNARANSISRVEFQTGDILKKKFAGKFDIITANLYSEILISALPYFASYLALQGCLILSGILRTQETGVARALRRQGFTSPETRRRGKWIALLARRRPEKEG